MKSQLTKLVEGFCGTALAVMALLLLCHLCLTRIEYSHSPQQPSRAKADLQMISAALDRYRMDYSLTFKRNSPHNTYPYPTIAGTDARGLIETAVTNFLPLGFTFIDSWGSYYVYEYDPSVDREKYHLWSYGAEPEDPSCRIHAGNKPPSWRLD